MKTYKHPHITILPIAINPHWVENSDGAGWQIDHVIDGVGDVELQTKGENEKWGLLWQQSK